MNLNLQSPKKQAGFIQFAVGAVLGAASLFEGNKARKAQNKARSQQQQSNRIRNLQAKRQFLRNFRVAQAQAIAAPLASGVQDSSFARATTASQGTQARVATREFNQQDALGEAASANLNAAANASFASGILGTLASAAQSPGIQDLFTSNPASTPRPTRDFQGRTIDYGNG